MGYRFEMRNQLETVPLKLLPKTIRPPLQGGQKEASMIARLNSTILVVALLSAAVGVVVLGLQPKDQAALLNNVSAGAGDQFVAGQAEILSSANTLCNNTAVMQAAQLGQIQAACQAMAQTPVEAAKLVIGFARTTVQTGQNGLNLAQDTWDALVEAAKAAGK